MSERSSIKVDVPSEVVDICQKLAGAGEKAYVVGGVVRDMLAGREAGDFDIATTATPQKVTTLFRRVVPTGMKHGTVTVLIGDGKYEVTTLRGEGPYSDGRHPDSVEFLSDIEDDLARRDFTVNAMAWDPIAGTIWDPFGGEADLARGIIRAVGDPSKRFSEDGLRVLRAARFAATLGFDVEDKTMTAMPAAAHLLESVSKERKRDELAKMLTAPKPSRGLEVMRRAGLLPFVCPELASLADGRPGTGRKASPWNRAMTRVDAVGPNLRLRLAALLMDAGLSGTVEQSARDSGELARTRLKEMRFDGKIVESVAHLVQMTGFENHSQWSDADVRRFVQRVGRELVSEVIELRLVDLEGMDEPGSERQSIGTLSKRVQSVIDANAPLFPQELAVSGQDIMSELSLEPGPEIGRLLTALVEYVIDNPENNRRDKLLSRAKELKS